MKMTGSCEELSFEKGSLSSNEQEYVKKLF